MASVEEELVLNVPSNSFLISLSCVIFVTLEFPYNLSISNILEIDFLNHV